MNMHGYGRVSTREQAESGLGLDAQRSQVQQGAASRGWTDVQWHEDAACSGSVAPEDRPVLGPLLASLDDDDVLVVAKLDRLGRSALDVLRIAAEADDDGWALVVLDLGLDTSTPVGRFTLTSLAAVAQLERDLVAQRTRDALAAAKRRGQRLGRPTEVPDEIRHRAHDLRHEGDGRTYSEVAEALNDEGHRTTAGTEWTKAGARRLVKSVDLDDEAEQAVAA